MILNNSPAIYVNGKMAVRVYSNGEIVWGLPVGYKRCKYLEFSRKQRYSVPASIGAKAGDIVTSTSKNKSAYNYNTIWGAPNQAELYYSNSSETTGMYYSAKITSKTTVDGVTTVVSKLARDSSNYFIADYDGNNISFLLTGNIYSFSVERNGKKIVDLIPCLNQNGEPCFYDAINKITIKNIRDGVCGYELMDGTYVAPI